MCHRADKLGCGEDRVLTSLIQLNLIVRRLHSLHSHHIASQPGRFLYKGSSFLPIDITFRRTASQEQVLCSTVLLLVSFML